MWFTILFWRVKLITYIHNIINNKMKFKEAEKKLNELFEMYLTYVEENTDENNNTEFDDEEEMMTNFLIFIES